MSNEKQLKKRGRKPKGGKIISNVNNINNNYIKQNTNVILHLNCNKSDINSHYNGNEIDEHQVSTTGKQEIITPYKLDNSTTNNSSSPDKQLFIKLSELSIKLHTNNITENNSSCFWCTCDFENQPIYIPENKINDSYNCYGCFCSPECATGYLFNENIDSSSKFERYYLLNYIYSKIYNYTKNIKPAPSPYYLLNKFNGSLTIEEYRKLLNSDRLILVVDKPLTRNFPELHEDNDDLNINHSNLNSYKITNCEKKNKNQILSKQFNL